METATESYEMVHVRLPASIKRRVETLARRERSSMNRQIVVLVEQALAEADDHRRFLVEPKAEYAIAD